MKNKKKTLFKQHKTNANTCKIWMWFLYLVNEFKIQIDFFLFRQTITGKNRQCQYCPNEIHYWYLTNTGSQKSKFKLFFFALQQHPLICNAMQFFYVVFISTLKCFFYFWFRSQNTEWWRLCSVFFQVISQSINYWILGWFKWM